MMARQNGVPYERVSANLHGADLNAPPFSGSASAYRSLNLAFRMLEEAYSLPILNTDREKNQMITAAYEGAYEGCVRNGPW